MSKDIQFIKDVCHLHKLAEEYKTLSRLTDTKCEELRKWRQFLTVTYPQYRKDL